MATKKGSKSSKTAHVLNVLSGPRADGEEMRDAVPEAQPSLADQTEQPKQEATAVPVPSAPRQPVRAPILEMARASDDALAEQIADLLEQEMVDEFPSDTIQKDVQGGNEVMSASDTDHLTDDRIEDVEMPLQDASAPPQAAEESQPMVEAALSEEAVVPEATASVEAVPEEALAESAPTETAEMVMPLDEADMEAAPAETATAPAEVVADVVPAEVAPTPVPVEETPPPAPKEEQPANKAQENDMAEYPTPQKFIELDDFCHVNVMQALVDEKCMKYIKMFGLCDCSRCVADVKALALTSLPSKYLVMHKGEVIPMLTVYEGRFSTAVTAQLINACKVVMDNPRHIRD